MVFALSASAIVAFFGVNAIRIGGETQRRLQQSSDLIADILPPPEYVIEGYLEATLAVARPDAAEPHLARLRKLEDEFHMRQRFWRESDLQPHLKSQITGDVLVPAQVFWRVSRQKLAPALQSKDRRAADAAYSELSRAYAAHRRAVDRLVTSAMGEQGKLVEGSHATLRRTTALLVLLGLLVLSATLGAALILIRRVVTPLADIAGVTTALSQGEERQVPGIDRRDELGEVARAVGQFSEAARARALADAAAAAEQRQIADVLGSMLATVASGDLRRKLDAELPEHARAIGENLDNAMGSLRGMVQAVVFSATAIRRSAAEISSGSEDLAQRTQSTASALEETSAALTNVDHHVTAVRDLAHTIVENAGRATATVKNGRDRARSAAAAMERVREAARDVDGVIEAVDKIAFQTRVLAMNAAVEAGHAGEAGRGFAVVADLVTQLAGRAEEEAKRAREQLTTTTTELAAASASVSAVEEDFSGIVGDVTAVNELLGKLAGEAATQTLVISEISDAIRAMDLNTQQNAAMVEQTSAAARSLLGETESMVAKANAFKWDRRERTVNVRQDRRGHRVSDPAEPNAGHVPIVERALERA